jgi:hypothetical protein
MMAAGAVGGGVWVWNNMSSSGTDDEPDSPPRSAGGPDAVPDPTTSAPSDATASNPPRPPEWHDDHTHYDKETGKHENPHVHEYTRHTDKKTGKSRVQRGDGRAPKPGEKKPGT